MSLNAKTGQPVAGFGTNGVVDLKVGAEALARLPETNVQYCEPQRPCTFVICPGNHRRWEIMLIDGEPREVALRALKGRYGPGMADRIGGGTVFRLVPTETTPA